MTIIRCFQIWVINQLNIPTDGIFSVWTLPETCNIKGQCVHSTIHQTFSLCREL